MSAGLLSVVTRIIIHKLRRYLRHDPLIALLNQRGIGYMLTVKP